MVEPVQSSEPISGRNTPTQKDIQLSVFYAPVSGNSALMDDRPNNRRRTPQARPSSSSSSGRRPSQIPNYGYPSSERGLNVPSPPYPPPSQPHYAGNSAPSGYYTLPQFAYPHPAYTPDGTPYVPVFPYQPPTHSSEGFSPFSVTPTPSPPSTSSPNPYAAQGAYHPLRVSPPMSSPQQYYGYGPYASSPGYQFYQPQEGESQWWYPQQQPQYDNEHHYQQHYHTPERFSPAVVGEPQPPPPLPPPPLLPLQPQMPQPSSSVPPRPQLKSPPAPISSTPNQSSQRQTVRKSYHPNPPSYRSEWVMWAGNVPSDATHDELWRFFTKGPNEAPLPVPISKGKEKEGEVDGGDGEVISGGVLSIFLISRSSCAFINYEGDIFLRAGIARFNGQSLRPHDSRIPKLVCRVRRREDDLKAGVGGQRGSGMHIKWVKDNRKLDRERAERSHSVSSHSSLGSGDLVDPMSALSVDSGDDKGEEGDGRMTAMSRRRYHSGSSSSYASTNSSLLANNFPKRFFILKSLTEYDLNLSLQKGIWATQRHNEGILDQAFRTSQEVYLIFGVNKSGEFYGYARMAGPISQAKSDGGHEQPEVPWAQRPPPSSASSSSSAKRERLHPVKEEPSPTIPPTYFDRTVEESPLPISTGRDGFVGSQPEPNIPGSSVNADSKVPQSAPAVLGKAHKQITMSTLSPDRSLNVGFPKPASVQPLKEAIRRQRKNMEADFELDSSAPYENMRDGSGVVNSDSKLDRMSEEEKETSAREAAPALSTIIDPSIDGRPEGWGEPFKVEWLCSDRLPFTRTKHIRNPWNNDREVKVSRDGTEIEPATGQMLLDEWERFRREPPTSSPTTTSQLSHQPWRGKRGGGTKGES